MQGLPVQHLMKPQMKKEISSKVNAQKGETEVSSEGQVELNESGKAVKGNSKNIDFASLLEGAKQDGTKKSATTDLAALLGKKSGEETTLENTVAKTTSSLDQLLNNLKKTNDSDATEETVDGNGKSLKKNMFPNHKSVDPEIKKDSPLDFLVKGAKDNKFGEVEVEKSTDAKSFFPNQAKIPNQILGKNIESDSNLNSKENLKLISGEEFVDAKKVTTDTKNFDPKKLNLDKNMNAEMFDPSKVKGRDLSQMKGYQSGQNLLNDNMIRTTKDLAFKEQKKGKTSAIDELLSPDMKKSNELSMIKESPIPMISSKLADSGITLKNSQTANVLDLSSMNMTAANKSQLIDKIADYVMQNNVASKDQVDLTVKHDSLGQFNIQVTKNPSQSMPNQIDMQIMTSNNEGHKFFVENEGALLKSLQQSGVNLSDLRIISSMTESTPNSFAESKQFNSFNQNQNGSSSSQQSFESFQSGDYRQGSEKRKDLWNEYRERYGA